MRKFIAILTMTAVTACSTANNITPIIDRAANYDDAKYQRDLSQCRDYANERDPAAEAAVGAVAGALLGFALGATVGGSDMGKQTIWTGAVAGGVGGAGNSALSVNDILVRCLKGRGYNVLGTKAGS